MFYILCWVNNSEEEFLKSVPLDLFSQSLKRYGSTIPVSVVFIENFNKLSKTFIGGLEKNGFHILDYSSEFGNIVARFSRISESLSRYERNCFLRWIALKELTCKVKGQFWHIDGDIILHTSLDSIADATKGMTFVLQGCPVLVSIADRSWLDIYEQNLIWLNDDVEGYSSAASKLPIDESVQSQLCNMAVYRNPMGHDQDLIEYLVACKRLPQASADEVFCSPFFYVQNPLLLTYWNRWLNPDNAVSQVVETNNMQLMIANKFIPFIHYQNDFCLYVWLFSLFQRVRLERWVPAIIDPRYGQAKEFNRKFYRLLGWLEKVGVKRPTRRDVIQMAMTTRGRKKDLLLVDVLNAIGAIA